MKNTFGNIICIVLSVVLIFCGAFCELIGFVCIANATNVVGIIIGIGLCLASIGLIVLSIIQIKEVIQGNGRLFMYD